MCMGLSGGLVFLNGVKQYCAKFKRVTDRGERESLKLWVSTEGGNKLVKMSIFY